MAIEAKRWFVTGIVQGVGFRYFVQERANSLNLTGWAKNLSDGRVEVLAIGSTKNLSHLAAALHMGPRGATVRTVDELEAAVEHHAAFSVR